jgi:hypothetical protein
MDTGYALANVQDVSINSPLDGCMTFDVRFVLLDPRALTELLEPQEKKDEADG